MARTLLYTVQRVAEKLDLDAFNSINDSTDSILIAREAEDTFYDLISRNEWPERYDTGKLESVGLATNPSALRIPSNVTKIKSVRYNVTNPTDTDTLYEEMEEVSNEEFFLRTYNRKSSDTNVTSVTYNGTELFIVNDKQPEYFTTFDNEYLIFDSHNSTVESTLQGAKSVVVSASNPTFLVDDSYVIPLDEVTYPLYLAELTAACSLALNGANDIESERRRARGMSRLRRDAYRTKAPDNKNYFGRDGNGRT